MINTFIDTHCHLDMLELTPEDAIAAAQEAQVSTLLTISVDQSTFEFVTTIINQVPCVYGSLGVHPHEAATFTDDTAIAIREGISQEAKLVAIGEMGLDYHYTHSEKSVQQQVFDQQLLLAQELNVPVVLHTRDAEQDTLNQLKATPAPRQGVAHSFTSSGAMAKELVDMGWYIGINGIVTFKNAAELREVVRNLPLDRILLETDSPFLTPVPLRGKPNDPSKIPLIAEVLAKEFGVSVATIAEQTSHNAETLFRFSQHSEP